jgi:hypothetical protein
LATSTLKSTTSTYSTPSVSVPARFTSRRDPR